MKIAIPEPGMAVFLCGYELFVDLHRSWCEQSALVSAVVVVADIIRGGLYQFFTAGKLIASIYIKLGEYTVVLLLQ